MSLTALASLAALASAAPPAVAADNFPPPVPEGPPIAATLARPAPERYPVRACSFQRAVCVHARRGGPAGAVLAALEDLQGAAAAIRALGLPAPLDDGTLGGDAAFDVYLVPASALPPPLSWQAVGRDAARLGTRDQASAFGLMRDDLGAGCARRHALTHALVSAVQWGQDAGERATAREAKSAYLAELLAPCAVVTAELIDDFQAHPERSLASSSPTVGAGVALALPWYLDAALGSGVPGVLPIALTGLGAQRTPANAWSWRDEPDDLDVLRRVLAARGGESSLPDLWVDFAIARLFMGARDDGAHFAESAFSGPEGRVRFDWAFAYASLPRRVTQIAPLEPTGTTYLWVDTRDAEPRAQLAFRFEWEAPVPFRWALVRVARDGSEASRVPITFEQKSTSADRVLDDVAGLAGVAVVGVNVGDIRASEPFDPDESPYEPHGFVVSVMRADSPTAPASR